MEFEHKPGDRYILTGVLYQSKKRFRLTTENPRYALGVNLWRGSLWQEREGKRTLLRRVSN